VNAPSSSGARQAHVGLPTGMLGVGLVVAPGLVLGLAASLPMSLVEHGWLWGTRLPSRCAGDFACMATFLFTQPLVMAALFGAGSAFGLAAQRLAGSGAPMLAAMVGGLTLYAGRTRPPWQPTRWACQWTPCYTTGSSTMPTPSGW
jgi:hypothetical protein